MSINPEDMEGQEAKLKTSEISDNDEVSDMVDVPEMTGDAS